MQFEQFDYSNCKYSIEFQFDKEKDTPMPVLPSKLIRAIRDLDEVLYVDYKGYDIEEKNAAQQGNAQQAVDDDGNPIPQAGNNEEVVDSVKMKLEVMVKGDSFDLSKVEEKEAE
jgi:hypothetical protein